MVAELDGDHALARSLLWVAVFRVVVVTTGLGLAFWQVSSLDVGQPDDVQGWQYLIISIAYGLGILGVLALRTGRYLRAVAYGQVVADACIVTAVVAMTGGAESVFGFTYVFVVLEGSMVLLGTGGLVATGFSTLLFGTVLVLQLQRFLPSALPPVNESRALFSFFVHTMGVGMVGLLASSLASKLRIAGLRLAEREEDFERLSELHAAILRALPAGLVTVGPDGRVRYGNEAARGILRCGARELEGARLEEVLPYVAQTLREEVDSGKLRPRRRYECAHVLDNGEPLRLGYSLAPLHLPGDAGTVVTFQDLTEVVRLEEAVERAERLAVVGKFAAGLAHEVRNPLASMCASIDVLEQSLHPPENMRRLMRNVVREAERLDTLIKDFLTLARPRKLSFERVDVSLLVASVLEMYSNDGLMREVEVKTELEPGVEASIDPDLIRQVLWNLVRNAAEALSTIRNRPRRLYINTRLTPEGPLVSITDNGPGLNEYQQRRVFEPFFSTKKEGTGLGLALSQSIAHAHGGRIELISRPGEGTRVELRLSAHVPTLDLLLAEPTPLGFEVVPGEEVV